MNVVRNLAIVVMVLGLVAFVGGVVFIGLGFAKDNQLAKAMRSEQVALPDVAEGATIDSAEEAQAAGDLIREHRRAIASTYGELLGGERFDPTNPKHLTYAQALNMENYLYLAVVGFGLIDLAMGSGALLVVVGIAIGLIGCSLLQLNRRLELGE